MNNYEFKEVFNANDFDPTDLTSNVSFTQAHFYGDWQKSLGRTVLRYVVYKNNEPVAYFQVIKYRLIRDKSYLYTPYGPVTKDKSDEFFIAIKKKLTELAKAHKAVFVRLDFTPRVNNETQSKFFKKSPLYTYHSAYFQPRFEWYLALDKPKEDLLKNMHEKTRYSIRLGEKRGAIPEIITENFEPYFDRFYELMDITARRNGFSIHDKAYYKNIFESLKNIKDSFLALSKYENKILVIDVIIVYGGVANYVFGASDNEERNRMPAYNAQWTAICHAKDVGCKSYNFGGVANESNIYKGWDGLTRFKKKFNGREFVHSDFFDIVVQPLWYYLYNFRKMLNRIKK